ncbi:MAG TPA: RpiB/LacA/LacB family sugar-phosphate isomerase [Candidatus Acidoferrales bacterium]|nr:RpiB/LacA/LacB family sugar-phosphate isomerase [Candidatus Acidoferrales bacterium]
MRIAFGSDEATPLTDAIDGWLREHGYEVERFGALRAGEDDAWTSMAMATAREVARGACSYGIVCCWSGTGASIAANKIAGVRAALCGDAVTASAARVWNDANVLALSLRATSADVAHEILDAWFKAEPTSDERYRSMIEDLREY